MPIQFETSTDSVPSSVTRAFTSPELVSLWDAAVDKTPAGRALAILNAADPASTSEALADLTLGERDRRLLALREQQFDRKLVGHAVCQACGERLEVELDTRQLTLPQTEAGEFSVEHEGWHICFRLPNSGDLANLPASAASARNALLERCIQKIEAPASFPASAPLPDEVAKAVEARMSEADPQAQLQLDLACAACKVRWTTEFDIASFFWSEIEGIATRILSDVHQIASVYHWSEREILALSPHRRAFYLNQIGA